MRMYRLGWLFEQLEINLSINLLWTTLFRNVLVRTPPARLSISSRLHDGAADMPVAIGCGRALMSAPPRWVAGDLAGNPLGRLHPVLHRAPRRPVGAHLAADQARLRGLPQLL